VKFLSIFKKIKLKRKICTLESLLVIKERVKGENYFKNLSKKERKHTFF